MLFVLENLERLEWLYSRLADDHSRQMLVNALRYRIQSRSTERSPITGSGTTATQRQLLAQLDRELLVEPHTKLPLFPSLNRYRVPGTSHPLELFADAHDIMKTFVLQQYAYIGRTHTVRAQPGSVVIDGGAGWGDAALYFADLVGSNGHVYSLELLPGKVDVIEGNLKLNEGLRDRVTVAQRALSDCTGRSISCSPHGGPTTLVRIDPWGRILTETPTLTIDDLVAAEKIRRVDFLKLNVGGGELEALSGAVVTISTHRPSIAVSLHHDDQDILRIPSVLDDLVHDYDFLLRHSTVLGESMVLFAHPAGRGVRA